jgi:hypothetical protein
VSHIERLDELLSVSYSVSCASDGGMAFVMIYFHVLVRLTLFDNDLLLHKEVCIMEKHSVYYEGRSNLIKNFYCLKISSLAANLVLKNSISQGRDRYKHVEEKYHDRAD